MPAALPMQVDAQAPNSQSAKNQEKLQQLQKQAEALLKAGFTAETLPYLAQLQKQIDALAPSPAKEIRTRASMTHQLATIHSGREASVKSHVAKLSALDAQLQKLQQEREQLVENHTAELKLWDAAKDQVDQAIKSLPELDVPAQVAQTPAPDPSPAPSLQTAFQETVTAQWQNLIAVPEIATVGPDAFSAIMKVVASALNAPPPSAPTLTTQQQQILQQQQAQQEQQQLAVQQQLLLQQRQQAQQQQDNAAAAIAAATAAATAAAASATAASASQQLAIIPQTPSGPTSGDVALPAASLGSTPPGDSEPLAKHQRLTQ